MNKSIDIKILNQNQDLTASNYYRKSLLFYKISESYSGGVCVFIKPPHRNKNMNSLQIRYRLFLQLEADRAQLVSSKAI